ncbi:MAG: hypothetical protein K6E35_05170, partial [Bacteroidales bacterium]|nr:hypothetical protein [Bacteroidales bacterium]
MYFSYDKTSDANLYPLDAAEVWDILEMNRNGEKPESLRSEPEPNAPEFVTAVGDDSISRFDAPKRKRSRGGKGRTKSRGTQDASPAQNNVREGDGGRNHNGQSRGGRNRGRGGNGRGNGNGNGGQKPQANKTSE